MSKISPDSSDRSNYPQEAANLLRTALGKEDDLQGNLASLRSLGVDIPERMQSWEVRRFGNAFCKETADKIDSLIKAGDPSSLQEVDRILDGLRAAAADKQPKILGPEDISKLITSFRDGSPEEACRAADVLGAVVDNEVHRHLLNTVIHGPENKKVLLHWSDEDCFAVLESAADALIGSPFDDIRVELIAGLSENPLSFVREFCAAALRGTQDTEAVKALEQAIKNDEVLVASEALLSLGYRQDDAVKELFTDIIRNPRSEEILAEAIHVLMYAVSEGQEGAKELVKSLASDPMVDDDIKEELKWE